MATASWEPIGNEWGANDLEWTELRNRLENGKCTPFIGAGACHGRLPVGHGLSEKLAKPLRYPFPDPHDLTRVSQFGSWRYFDPIAFKEHVADHLTKPATPSSGAADVHRILASFPLPIYITTNYDDLMVEALRSEGKCPVRMHYPWYTERSTPGRRARAENIAPPTADRPLVYHLHGHGGEPHSMVVTEADYHTYLANLTRESVGEQWSMPAQVSGAIARRQLLFIGYSLQDSTFRVLFHGLVKQMAQVLRPGNISVQIPPKLADDREQTLMDAKDYLRKYFDQLNVSVFWGGSDVFFERLSSHA